MLCKIIALSFHKNSQDSVFVQSNTPITKATADIDRWFGSDQRFDQLYPASERTLSSRHWTPLHMAREAARFLTSGDQVKILDIGSGVGKFWLAAAYYNPKPFYYAIEQRKQLVHKAEITRQILRFDYVSFKPGNFTQVNFRDYDHFYFYNSFYENIEPISRIDDSIDYSEELYKYYNRYLYGQLGQAAVGTRLATFHTPALDIPSCFSLADALFDNLLNFWIKAE